VERPAGEYNIHRHGAYIEGTPAGRIQITVTQPDEGRAIFVEGTNKKNQMSENRYWVLCGKGISVKG